MVWWKDDDDAVFPGIGEVKRGPWVNGAAQPCSSVPFLCLQCFSAELPGYTSVKWTPPGGSELPMTLVAGDHWRAIYTVAGQTFTLDAYCGAEKPGCTSLSITGPSNIPIFQQPQSLDHSTHTYNFKTYAFMPDAWPSGTVLMRLIPPVAAPSIFTGAANHSNGVTSLALTWIVPLPSAMPVVYGVIQYGTDVSGGILTDPGIFLGGSKILTTTSHRLTLFYVPSVGPGPTMTIPVNNTADMVFGFAAAIGGGFAGILDEHTTIEGHAAGTDPVITIASPAHSPGIQMYALTHMRTSPTPLTVLQPSTWTTGDQIFGPSSSNVIGGTPLYEGLSYVGAAGAFSGSPWSSATAHFLQSLGWDGMIFHMH